MKITIKRGLDIPLAGKPSGEVQQLPKPRTVSLNLDPFQHTRFKLHVKVGDTVKLGDPLAESKGIVGQMFVSPAGGVVKEVRRGLKRRLIDLVIEVAEHEEERNWGPLQERTREAIVARLLEGGVFPHLRMRPFDLIADPAHLPRDIFVRAIESAPFVPPAELQVKGQEEYFQTGLDTLAKLTTGKVHLVYREGSSCSAFTEAKNVERHTAQGPHPIGNASVHIEQIAPIRHGQDVVWTLSAVDAITVGKMIAEGRYFTDRILSIGGNGVIEGRSGYFQGRLGFPITDLISDRIRNELLRFISGDPLTGDRVEAHDFLSFYHTAFSVIPENIKREPFHFFRLGLKKYSATRAYFMGHVKPPVAGVPFTTSQHGEERAFIDGKVYEKVMPLHVPTMQLVKALLSEDFETAETLGLLEVAAEDFALPAFICPSKIEMIDIVAEGLHRYALELGH